MVNNRYLYGLIGLVAGFIVSYFATQYYNDSEGGKAAASQGVAQPGAPGAQPGSGGQPSMAEVQEVIAKARSNPKDPQAQIEAAGLYYQIRMIPESIEFLKRAAELEPQKFGIPATIGNLYLDQKNYAEAETWYRRAVTIKADEPELYVEIAATLLQRQSPDPNKAVQELDRALKLDPQNTHALAHMIDAQLLRRDAEAADQALARLRATEPANNRISLYQGLIADLRAGRPVNIPKE
ncbi:MAG TPA: tetratricopeptide repeat protein [Blastocatellia bacterium]|nr:tetratricopeptide repeat protein [Blastocatellia bacterium]